MAQSLLLLCAIGFVEIEDSTQLMLCIPAFRIQHSEFNIPNSTFRITYAPS